MTVEWTKFTSDTLDTSALKENDDDNEDGDTGSNGYKALPPVPDESIPQGVLPRVIKTLVDRWREVKALLKKAKEPAIRQ
jgi:hypothetical protein